MLCPSPTGCEVDTPARQSHTHLMIDRDPTKLTLDDWLADLKMSEAEVDVGELVPGEVVMATIQAAIGRLEARLAGTPQQNAAPRQR